VSDASSTVDERQESVDKSRQGPALFDNPKFQARMIPMALNLLLVTIDECRYMLQNSRTARPLATGSVTPEYGKHLSARERKILDQAVSQFSIELQKAVDSEFGDDKELDAEEGGDDDSLYPFSTETVGLLIDSALRDVKAELFAKHFARFYDDPSNMEYILAKVRLGPDSSRELILGTALLPLIVSQAEEFLGAMVRTGLSLYPSALGEPPSVPNDIISKYQRNISSSDIRRWQIDRQVSDFLKGSPNEWRRTLERWTRIDITNLGADWNMLNEMIQRRHAVIHNGGLADSDYLAKISPDLRKGLYPGSSLVCNMAYIDPVLIELETWAICLALQCSKRFFKEEQSIYNDIINRVTRLQGLGRWTQGLAIMNSFLAEPIPLDSEDVILAQINRWFCLQELGRDNESIQREIRSWRAGQSIEQTAVEYREVGRLALLRDYEGLVAALNKYLVGPKSQTEKRALSNMPLMKRAMQESPRVRTVFRGGKQSPQSPQHGASQPRSTRKQPRRK
jgi:hypothetical protein